MKILIDARYLDGSWSGIGTYSRYLIEHLSKIDQKNEYMVLIRPGFKDQLDVGDNFEFLTFKPKVLSFQTLFSLHRYMEALEPDIVHSLAPVAPVFWDGPLIVTLHDMQPMIDPDFHARRAGYVRKLYQMFYGWAYPTVLAQAKWVLCDSIATRDDAQRLYPGLKSKLIVCHPGVATIPVMPTENQTIAIKGKIGVSDPYFLYYGSTRPNKNLRNLIKAFSMFLDQQGDSGVRYKLVMVLKTDRFFDDVQKEIRKQGIDQHVIISEPLEPEAHRALLNGAHALTFPTRYEGFGFPVLEAMQLGVPVLASTSGSLPEVGGDNAVFVDSFDLADIVRGMRKIAGNEALRNRFRLEGPNRASLFSWEETAENVYDVYRLLIN